MHKFLLFFIFLTSQCLQAKDCLVFVPAGRDLSFWQEMESGISKHAKKLNYTLITRGPKNEDQKEEQIQIIKEMLEFNCKGMILAPNSIEAQKFASGIKSIPIILVDRKFNSDDSFSLVATNNYNAGKMAALELIKKFKNKGTVLIFKLDPLITSTDKREVGFIDQIKKSKLTYIDAGYTSLKIGIARSVMLKKIQTYYQKINAVFISNESNSMAYYMAISDFNKTRIGKGYKSTVIGFDINPELQNALELGYFYSFVVQDPKYIGEKAILKMDDYLSQNKKIESEDIPVKMIFSNKIKI